MRHVLVLLATTTLAACGGAGPTSAGGSAAPSGAGAGAPGAGAGSASGHTFVAPTEPKTYQAVGSVHSYKYSTDDRNDQQQYSQLYAGDATTARNSGISVTYNPRDAIFDIVVNQPLANVNLNDRYQDPVHRTDFGGDRQPQDGNPNIAGKGIQYLEAGGGSNLLYDGQSTVFPVGNDGGTRDVGTFFYQKPGTNTNYVTFAGFLRNRTSVIKVEDPANPGITYLRQDHLLERGAFVWGERSPNNVVPTSGTGTFSGDMLATMVFNPLLDTDRSTPTYFQWISGTSSMAVNFAANSFTIDLTGTTFAPQFDIFTSRAFAIGSGATFAAAGAGRLDLVNAGGFLGQFTSASFAQGGVTTAVNIAGSSVDGAFFGPAAQEVGGGFRIVGGTPDERIDILGAFTGKRP